MDARNPGCELDLGWVNSVRINLPSVKRRAETLGTKRTVKKQWQAAWLLRAVTCIDLTTLSGDDTDANVDRLCHKAAHPIRHDIIKALGMEDAGITCGAVCVYPARVEGAVRSLKKIGCDIPVAAVATGFPSGQYYMKTRLEEIKLTVAAGAKEIDIVINREMALTGNWKGLYEELKAMREACGDAHMKAILAVGELGSMANVYKASLVAMMAGSDFIKTSTGKEGVNAILPVGVVMCRAIREYHQQTGYKVGFKPAGGIRAAKDALNWLVLIKEELGDGWLNNHMFRIGASGLLGDIERQLFHYVYGRYAAGSELPMA
ncbi:deoxyribose-phosphate aldolase-like [Macrobrachium nipponense]|uniref:deoxyribose-phosphate aldolase-like n=1 Tax=Macrobrachium nipponense TaxID=159736 RepID=UPI0030C897CA